MALPVTFATLTAGNQPLSLLDTQSAALGALGVIPCAAAGQNAIALTPNPNTPTISGYTDLAPSFSFAAAQNSTGAITINVAGIGARNCYKWNGLVSAGPGDLDAGSLYKATFLTSLNSGAGGFVIDTIGFQANISDVEFVIDGGGNPITTGVKGYLRIPFSASILSWALIADQSGSIAIDVLRNSNGIPVTSIVGAGTKPNLSAAQFAGSTAPSGWTSTFLSSNDYIGFTVSSAATVTRVTIDLSLGKA